MNANVTSLPNPTPVEKRRTITMTNQPPVQIKDSEWPVVAQGSANWDHPGYSAGWIIEIRVRKKVDGEGQMIVHANYNYSDEDLEEGQQVRVGRVLSPSVAHWDLPNQLVEIADELRARILNPHANKAIVFALDMCFASLEPTRL